MGQILLAKRMGKRGLSPRPARGSTAWPQPRWQLCLVLNAWLHGRTRLRPATAQCVPHAYARCGSGAGGSGPKDLKEAVNEAMRDWVTNVRSTHYILGTAYGAHPYPVMVRNFHRLLATRRGVKFLEQEERLPDLLTACVGGGSNAIGLFYPFIEDESVSMVGRKRVEKGLYLRSMQRVFRGSLGVLQGTRSYLLQDEVGQIQMTHSVSAGLRLCGGGTGARVAT